MIRSDHNHSEKNQIATFVFLKFIYSFNLKFHFHVFLKTPNRSQRHAMEERTFKCSECEAKFGSVDLLLIHQRRHDMSLNLSSKTGSSSSGMSLSTPSIFKGSLSAGIIGFPDETPTPTRFIRNCEEVGLFQDLQNVNPFDEVFKKAAGSGTSTPSGDGVFEFGSFLSNGTPILDSAFSFRSSRSKRRYSEQDTLNTPQVFPYFNSTGGSHTLTTNTASMSACLTPTPQSEGGAQESLRSVIQLETPVSTTSYNHEEHVSIITYTSAIRQQTNKSSSEPGSAGSSKLESPRILISDLVPRKSVSPSTPTSSISNSITLCTTSTSQSGKLSSLRIRSKSNLKLDLKTVIPKKSLTELDKIPSAVGSHQSQKNSERETVLVATALAVTSPSIECATGKKELLERNRAAAHRSRERRKQWIYGLESRCRALEALLADSQAEITSLKADNERLRKQLNNQTRNADISTDTSVVASVEFHADTSTTNLHQSHSRTKVDMIVPDLFTENDDTSAEGLVVTIGSPIVLPKTKAKRGRPRRGEERRVPILSVPISNSVENVKELPKIPILPISKSKRKS